jgi:hypothetical protein
MIPSPPPPPQSLTPPFPPPSQVDVGANVLSRFGPSPTMTGFHSAPSIPIITRAADIRRPTKPNPLSLTSDRAAHVHPEDWRMHERCIEWLAAKGAASRAPRAGIAVSQGPSAGMAVSRGPPSGMPTNGSSSGTSRPWFQGPPTGITINGSSSGTSRPWFLYCSLNIPHPPFKTNSTWLPSVNQPAVREAPPPWPQLPSMHPYDSYMSTAKVRRALLA